MIRVEDPTREAPHRWTNEKRIQKVIGNSRVKTLKLDIRKDAQDAEQIHCHEQPVSVSTFEKRNGSRLSENEISCAGKL